MTRRLFFSFFLCITVALAFVALLGLDGWLVKMLVVLGCGVFVAVLASRLPQRDLANFETAAAAIGTSPVVVPTPRFSDFEGLAQAISHSSNHVEQMLTNAAESRRELEAMIDSMQDAVVAVDVAGRIQWTNQRMQKLIPGTPFSSSVRIGHALVQTIRDPEVLECVRLALEQRVVSERRSTSLLPGRIFEVAASPMPGGGAVAVLHDITRIEQMERTQREFVANVSHELRTPLTSITGYVETLLDHEDSLSPQAREFLSTIHKNATRMNRLTEDLLVMARVESSEQELHPAAVRADMLVRDAVQAMSGMVQDEEAVLRIGEATDCEVYADQDAVVQVLSNLIENAIKYGKPRPEEPSRVLVSVKAEIEGVEFRVQDFGQGIASEHQSRIFERFYRVDKARSRESGGTGLGLAIARHVVETQGGTIRVESELGTGSTFIFTLPRASSGAI
ncbi:sensor histidine kinase [Edaphobacter modestus]|uniref:histidine kinase n=1 Tax=Edaphobacter modestus TaxID=388466 RepID=A0A4Q7YPY8_9BACT|nr:ATP-binding protein [Edaphobacter modestus]RZU39498.1 two-component system phosphate regulon sensor histidine kinase PhoR [Edaphobacter modestus]